MYIIQNRRSSCASPTWRPRLRLGLQSLGSAQKDSLLLNDIIYYLYNRYYTYCFYVKLINK
jgi:hypothetical protein